RQERRYPDRVGHRDHPTRSAAPDPDAPPGPGHVSGPRRPPAGELTNKVATGTIPTALRSTGVAGRIRSRPGTIALVGLVVLAAVLVAAVTVGSARIGPTDTLGAILQSG